MHPTRHLATCTALAVTVGVLAACTPDDPGPTTSPSTASSTPSTPASPSASPTTPKEIAFAAADATYREWIKNYAEAWKALDPALVNQDLVSEGLYAFAQTELTKFAKDRAEGTYALFSIDVKSFTPTSYLPDGVAIRYCQLVDTRFIDKDGQDVTLTPGGAPAPVNTTYRTSDITFITTDGGTTWRVDRFSQSPTEGEPC